MSKEEQIELKLDLEPTEKEEEVVIKEVEEAPKAELTVEDGINELKFKLEEERKAREAAERRAKEAADSAAAAKNDANDSNMRLINNAIETVVRNTEILKQNYKDALASGDYDAAANFQMEMIKADNDLRQLNVGKQQYEAAMKQPQIADPVEKMAAQLTPQSAAWVRAHPEYARDAALTRRMVRAHEDAVDDGLVADTPEYFQFIETKLKIRQPEVQVKDQQESALSEAASATQRRSAPPAAPPSRTAATSAGGRSNVITLTRAERETAAALGMTDREYAQNKRELIKEGKLVG
jgi:hypothetical protein